MNNFEEVQNAANLVANANGHDMSDWMPDAVPDAYFSYCRHDDEGCFAENRSHHGQYYGSALTELCPYTKRD